MIYPIAFLTALLTLTLGAPVDTAGKTVHIPLQKEVGKFAVKNATIPADKKAELVRRSTTDEQPFTFTGIRYFTDYEIGGQKIKGLLDTGSSDTFVFAAGSGPNGYAAGQSPDYHWQDDSFQAAYGDGSNRIAGSWFTDDITLGAATIKSYNLGLVNYSTPNFPNNIGILAVGPVAAETAEISYPPLYQRLKTDGYTESASYSLFTNDESGSSASLLFGGIDTAKFSGPLNAIQFAVNEVLGNQYYSIDWQYKGVWYENGVLDSGTPFLMLTDDVVSQLAEEYGAVFDSTQQAYVASGSPDLSKPPLPITVGGVTINIPVEYLWMEGDGFVWFGVQPSASKPNDQAVYMNILGDPFLRSVYSFYDIDSETYYFAPIKFTSDSQVVGVSGSVPGSQSAPDPNEGHTGNGNPDFTL